MIAALLRRDLATLLPGGRGGSGLLPLLFFLAVAMLYPFAVGPDAQLLARTGGGVIWIAALLAAILPRLAAAGIGVNPVSAFHHDHLFVPSDRAEDALAILSGIAVEARAGAIGRGPVASN